METNIKPGYQTSEFWQATITHVLAFVITLLDLLHVHWSHGLSAVQAAVPVIALVTSASLASVYHDKRLALKMDHAAQGARTYIAELEHGYTEYAPHVTQVINEVKSVEPILNGVVAAVDPSAEPAVAEAEHVADEAASAADQVVQAWHENMRDVPVEAAASPEAVAPEPAAPTAS